VSASAAQARDSAYGEFAAFYDQFTAAHDYDLWVSVIEALMRRHGFFGRELIDAACGTGKSLLPWARRGFDVCGFDRSSQMVDLAQAKCRAEGLAVKLSVADLRDDLDIVPAPLVTCLDDVLNYQLHQRDLCAAVRGLASLVAPGGVLVFDINTELTYASSYVRTSEVHSGDLLMRWQGRALGDDIFEATITVSRSCRPLLQSVHRQRFWPTRTVAAALRAADATLVAIYGMARDGSVERPSDPARHHKLLFLATR
jgi:SAM-dependent methyltransferase